MQIRKTTLAHVDAVAAIYDTARVFMCEQGNPTQWAGEYPNADTARADVADGVGYVCEEDGRVVGTGTHAELMEACPEYRQIALSQLSPAELEKGGAR